MISETIHTIIEYRFKGKLYEVHYDEPKQYIKNSIDRLIEAGATEFSVVKNSRNLDLSFLP